jgi:hypothetical protein
LSPINIGAAMLGLSKRSSAIVLAVIAVLVIILGVVLYRHYHNSSTGSSKSTMQSDPHNWPSADVFGAMADTYPYGNYAGHVDMYYPSYDPRRM